MILPIILIIFGALATSSFTSTINIGIGFCLDNNFDNFIVSSDRVVVGTDQNDFIFYTGKDKTNFLFGLNGNDCIVGNKKSFVFCGEGDHDSGQGKHLFSCERNLEEFFEQQNRNKRDRDDD